MTREELRTHIELEFGEFEPWSYEHVSFALFHGEVADRIQALGSGLMAAVGEERFSSMDVEYLLNLVDTYGLKAKDRAQFLHDIEKIMARKALEVVQGLTPAQKDLAVRVLRMVQTRPEACFRLEELGRALRALTAGVG